MTGCFVLGCKNNTGRTAKHVHMHIFPRQRDRVINWLDALGVPKDRIETICQEILNDKKGNLFRVCSEHFESSAYTELAHSSMRSGRIMLRRNAVPLRVELMGQHLQEAIDKNVPNSVETQTDFDLSCQHQKTCMHECIGFETKKKKQDVTIQLAQFEINFEGDLTQVQKDHTYAVKEKLLHAKLSTPVKGPFQQLISSASISPIVSESSSDSCGKDIEMEPIIEEESGSEEADCPTVRKHNGEGLIESGEETVLTHTDAESSSVADVVDEELETMVCEKKYIVYHSALLQLFSMVTCSTLLIDRKCRKCDTVVEKNTCINCGAMIEENKCGKPMLNFEIKEFGSCIKITATCFNNHSAIKWSSQPMLGNVSAGNLQLGSAILFSGMNFDKFEMFAGFLGLQVIAKPTYYRYQCSYLFPTISTFWENEQQKFFSEVEDTPLRLSGDGQCDSPGHNAKYLIYSMMDQESGKIVSSEVVQVTECSSSVAMEKHAFVKSVDKLLENGVNVEMITTDRHVGIAKVMRERYRFIRHQYGVWHLSKSVKKKISLAAKKKNCSELGGWCQSIGNHLWWCSRTCNRSLDVLREKWMSILHHTKNKHHWDGHKCPHPRIPRIIRRTKMWLKTATPAHNALEKIVSDKRLLKDLAGITHFTHTGNIEVFHSTVLKYRRKSEHYSIDGMEARTRLAILATNANVGRDQARIQSTSEDTRVLGELRYTMVFSKLKKAWVLKKVFEEMDYSHVYDMMISVLEMKKNDIQTQWKPRAGDFPKNNATCPPPTKSELISRHISRFSAD